MSSKKILLQYLADGRFHSGQTLAGKLGVSRTAVWKHIQALQEMGLEIYSVRGKGHRLVLPIELLDENSISAEFTEETQAVIKKVGVFFQLPSTNQYLLEKMTETPIHGYVTLAEYQSAGRGRRGKGWQSPVASGLYLSMSWRFAATPASLTALPLASGVAVISALTGFNINALGLKWPNDILCHGLKLGGLLLESRVEAGGSCDVVLGLGINWRLPDKISSLIPQEVTDIYRHCETLPSRNRMAGRIINELTGMFRRYESEGFACFIEAWRKLDILQGKQAWLSLADSRVRGEVLGIDEHGQLLMKIKNETQKFTSGELSIRAAS